MESIFSHINNNNISQIDSPRYGPINNIACEFNIPIYLASQNKKIVVCLPDDFSPELSHEYIKSNYPTIRTGYANNENISYNLSTQINYISEKYLKYKILKYFQNNTRVENFADIIIIFNPNMDNNDNIFIISSFKYACNNNILFPKLCILNTEYYYKLSDNRISFKNERKEPKIINIKQINFSSTIKNIAKIAKDNYHKYPSNILIYVSNLNAAKLIYNCLSILNYKTLMIDSDYNNTINTFTDLLYIKSKKIIIAINFNDFQFLDIGLVINVSRSLEYYPKVLGLYPPNECYSFNNETPKPKHKEDIFKSISHLIGDYVNCDMFLNILSFDTDKFENVTIKNITNLMLNLNLLIRNNDKLSVSPIGFFAQKYKLTPQKASFIWGWIGKGYPLYQGIVIASLIDEIYFLNNKIFTPHVNYIGESPIHTYLNIFNLFNIDHKNDLDNIIKNNISICKKWIDSNNLSHNKFSSLISNISELYNNIVKDMRNLDTTISDFDVKNIINLAIPILNDIYLGTILIVKNNSILQPHENVKYLLNKYSYKKVLKDAKIIPLALRPVQQCHKHKTNDNVIFIDNFIIV
jgi:hypothetical protein